MLKALKKATGIVKDVAATVGIPVTEKTIDADYTQAKEAFKTICLDTVQIIGCIIQMSNQMQVLSRSVTKIGADLEISFITASQNSKGEAKAIEMFGKQLESIVSNQFARLIDQNVVAPLSVYQKETDRLKDIQKQRKPLRKEYDQARSKLKWLQDHNGKVGEIEAQNQKTQEAYNKYSVLNNDFIQGVNRLVMQRAQYLETPFRNFVGIFSKFMCSVTNEMERVKTSFPPSTYNKYAQFTPANPYSQAQPQQAFYAPPPEPVAYPTIDEIPVPTPVEEVEEPQRAKPKKERVAALA